MAAQCSRTAAAMSSSRPAYRLTMPRPPAQSTGAVWRCPRHRKSMTNCSCGWRRRAPITHTSVLTTRMVITYLSGSMVHPRPPCNGCRVSRITPQNSVCGWLVPTVLSARRAIIRIGIRTVPKQPTTSARIQPTMVLVLNLDLFSLFFRIKFGYYNYDNIYLFLTDYFYTVTPGQLCSGSTGSGSTLTAVKAACNANPDCVAFSFSIGDGVGDTKDAAGCATTESVPAYDGYYKGPSIC